MKTETNLPTRPANLLSLIPIDLRAWMPAAELAAAAREAAETFYWLEADEEDYPPFGGCACPLRKLATLTYCYAAGTLADDLIALEMVEDPTLRSLTGDAVFAPDKLRLFRAHNSELIKLCLARVLEQAWCANIGERGASRGFFATEAAHRVQLAWQAERPAAIADGADPETLHAFLPRPIGWGEGRGEGKTALALATTSNLSPLTSPCPLPSLQGSGEGSTGGHSLGMPAPVFARFAAAACVLLALLLWARPASAETLPQFTYDGRTYTNATVHQSSPVDIIVRDEAQGFVRIPLRDIPEALKPRFPYDPRAAADYEREKAGKAQAQREQARATTLNTLLRQEADVLVRIRDAERNLAALQRQLDVLNVSAKGKKNSSARQEADRLREVKRDHIAHVDQLRVQLAALRQRQAQYR